MSTLAPLLTVEDLETHIRVPEGVLHAVDRVSFSAGIPGTGLRAMIASDWDTKGLVSNQTNANRTYAGHPFNLDDSDDANSWVGVISKLDSPQEFRDTVDRGDTAYNYGVYFEYKKQSWADDLTDFSLGGSFDDSGNWTDIKLRGVKVDKK